MRYDLIIQDDPRVRQLIVTGKYSTPANNQATLEDDYRFTFKSGEFSGQIPYQAIDFMPQDIFVVTDFYPQPLDPSLPCDFTVRLHSPRKTALATGKMTEGAFKEENVRSFALVLSDRFEYLTDRYQDIDLRCLYYPENPALARTVLDHAKKDLAACEALFGFFPYQALTFTPAATKWRGGCPLATGVLGLHHRPEDQVLMGNNWIITHEICHEYWGEYVKDAEPTGWLGIGLGLATDHELSQDKNLHRADLQMYLKACADGKRTAIDIPLSEFEQLMATPEVYDYNSSVIHGKSGAIMAKIKAMIGKEAFFRALSKLLQGYAGRSIDRHAFLKAIRDESGRDYAKELHHWLKTDDCITGDTP